MPSPKKKTTTEKPGPRRAATGPTTPRAPKERPSVPKKIATVSALDVDRAVREEVTEWFTSNRKGLETVFRRVADQVREELDTIWGERVETQRDQFQLELRKYAEENAGLRERVRNMEEEVKRMRGILGMVRNQVTEEAMD